MPTPSNPRHAEKAAVALFLHNLHPEAHHTVISSVASVAEIVLLATIDMEHRGELAEFAKKTPGDAQGVLADSIAKICNPATLAPDASSEMLRVITLLSAWQSGLLLRHARQAAGSDPSSVLGGRLIDLSCYPSS